MVKFSVGAAAYGNFLLHPRRLNHSLAAAATDTVVVVVVVRL